MVRRMPSAQTAYLATNPPEPIFTDSLVAELDALRSKAVSRPEQIATALYLMTWAGKVLATGTTVTGQPWGPVALAIIENLSPIVEEINGGQMSGRLGMVDPNKFGTALGNIYEMLGRSKNDDDE